MAATLRQCRNLFASQKLINISSLLSRPLGTSSVNQQDESKWFSKLWVRKLEPTKESHSRMLSDKETIYELSTHDVKADRMEAYIDVCHHMATRIHEHTDIPCELIGSWRVDVGDQDQALHLWKYTGGYRAIEHTRMILKEDTEHTDMIKERTGLLRKRSSQFILKFSYWPEIEFRKGNNIYEIRSYVLKPGTMIEWGNSWARAINFRQHNDEAFAGFFSQIGVLNNVHHIFAYKDLQSRKETREAAWRVPGWDECVAYTVPLIREMEARIMSPLACSPTQ